MATVKEETLENVIKTPNVLKTPTETELFKQEHGKLPNGTYRREIKRTWWTQIPFYIMYMVREGTAIFMLLYTMHLMVGLNALSQGKEAFVSWSNAQNTPFLMGFAFICFVMAMYHTATWFFATPKVMPIQIKDKKVPAKVIISAHWLMFFGAMVVTLFLAGI